GVLEFGIGGPPGGLPGVAFGQFSVDGAARLDGTLAVTLLNQFIPAKGNGYAVLEFASRVGDFANKTGLDLGNGKHFVTTFNPPYLSVVVVVDPPKTATTVTSSTGPFDSVFGQAVTFTVTVKALQGTNTPIGWVDLYDNGTVFRSGAYNGGA